MSSFGFNTISGPGGQPLAQPAPVVASAFAGGAVQQGADALARFAQASIQRDKRMLLTQTQTGLIAGVDEARIQALNSANPTEAAEAFDQSMEVLTDRVNEIGNEDVRVEAIQYLERRGITAKSSLIAESSRKATAEDLIVLDTFLKQAVLEGDEDEASRQIFGRVGTTLTQGQADAMFREFQVGTQLEFMNQVLRTEPQNFDEFMKSGSFDKLNEGTLLAAAGMASRAQVQQGKVGVSNAFSNAKADIDEVLSNGFKPDALASHMNLQTEIIFAEPGNISSRNEIRTALLEPGLKASAAELQPNQFDAIAALMPDTPENRTLIADERRVMEGRIESGQVVADGADVIGAVLDHGATGLELPQDEASWDKYTDRRLLSGDSVAGIAVDILGAGQPLPSSIIHGMQDMSNEATLDMGGLLAIYGDMDARDAAALSSTMPQPELNELLRDTAQNYEPSNDIYLRRVAALESPRVRAALPNAAIRFDGGKIGDEEIDAINVSASLGDLLGGQAFRQFFLDPNAIITPGQLEAIRESFIIDAASQSGLYNFDLKNGSVDSMRDRAIKDFSLKFRMYTIDVFGRNDVAFTDQITGSFDDRQKYQKGLSDWITNGTKQPGMIFELNEMQVTPSVRNGIVDSFMVYDPQGKFEARVVRPTEDGFSEARDIFYGLVPPQQRNENPALAYQARYGNKAPKQVSTEVYDGIRKQAEDLYMSLNVSKPETDAQWDEYTRMYNKIERELGWPEVQRPPEE